MSKAETVKKVVSSTAKGVVKTASAVSNSVDHVSKQNNNLLMIIAIVGVWFFLFFNKGD